VPSRLCVNHSLSSLPRLVPEFWEAFTNSAPCNSGLYPRPCVRVTAASSANRRTASAAAFFARLRFVSRGEVTPDRASGQKSGCTGGTCNFNLGFKTLGPHPGRQNDQGTLMDASNRRHASSALARPASSSTYPGNSTLSISTPNAFASCALSMIPSTRRSRHLLDFASSPSKACQIGSTTKGSERELHSANRLRTMSRW
jgi:hypothetical protein